MMTRRNSSTRSLPTNVKLLALASMFNDISGEIVARALPLFLAGTVGIGYATIGFIEGIAETTSALLKIASGWYSDRWGKRKWVTAIGYGLTSSARPILYFANSWVLPLVSRFIDRAGKGIRTSPRDALIADSVEPNMRGRAFGLQRAMDPLGAVIGGVLAALALNAMGGNISGGEISKEMFRTLVLIATPATVLSSILVFGFVKEARASGTVYRVPGTGETNATHSVNTIQANPGTRYPEPGTRKTAIRSLLHVPNLQAFLIAVTVMALGMSSDAFLLLRAHSLGISPVDIFIIIALFNVLTTIAAYPAGVLADHLHRKTILRIGWTFYALIYIGFAFATQAWHIWALYILYGLYYALSEGTERALVADIVESDKRGSAYGLYNGAVGLMVLPASVIAGLLWQSFGPQAPFLFGAAAAIVAVGLIERVRTAREV